MDEWNGDFPCSSQLRSASFEQDVMMGANGDSTRLLVRLIDGPEPSGVGETDHHQVACHLERGH